MTFPMWAMAGLWGLIAGSALLIGAVVGYRAKLSQRLIAGIMAFGSGVLISALSFELMDEAFKKGGFDSTSIGFVSGAVVYTLANWLLSKKGAKHRKRSGTNIEERQPSEGEHSGSGSAIAIGALLDGIPESIVIGVSMLAGGIVSSVTVIAIFISNIPEGLSSSSGMKHSGRSAKYVFGLWTSIALSSALASIFGYTVVGHLSEEWTAGVTSVAAGAVLAMIVDTMIPEAFESTRDFAGLVTVLGFLASFILSKLGDIRPH